MWSAIKAFVHGVYTAGANICSYLGGRLYYHLIRPVAEYAAKAALGFVQIVSHLSFGIFAQGGYIVAKAVWHFLLHPVWKAVKWTWNNLALPLLYYALWTPVKFVAEKLALFIAAVLQVPFDALVLTFGGLGVGTWFALSELALFLKSHWISKAIYPVPIAAWLRGYEAQKLGNYPYQQVGTDTLPA